MSSIRDAHYMARALRLAEKGRYISHPNPAVGCVLVRDDTIVGEGFTQQAGGAHAEAGALERAGNKAAGATAYVTLEPCSFHGRTPSCAEALAAAGVKRAVVATLDPDPRNAGAGIDKLKSAGVEVVSGVMETSARAQLQGHCMRYEAGRPFVTLKLGMSLDGKTALSNGESKWITSADARSDVQRLRAGSSAIVTGVQTVNDDDPMLSVRAAELRLPEAEAAGRVIRPVYVLDPRGRVDGSARLMDVASTVLVTGPGITPRISCEHLETPLADNQIDLNVFLGELAQRGHSNVLFECGATLAGSLVQEKLVDELVLYVAPRLMGSSARSLLNLPELARMSDLVDLTIVDIRQIGTDIRITARPAGG